MRYRSASSKSRETCCVSSRARSTPPCTGSRSASGCSAEWKGAESGREAKFYRITAAGRKQLEVETSSWERLSAAVALVMRANEAEEDRYERRRVFSRRQKREELLDKELRFHLEEQIRESIAAGMNPEQARREALLEFGGLDQIKEECRDVARATWLDALVQDVKFSFRSLGKSLGFTLTALATMGIGIGFNAAIYSYLDGILLRPIGLENADRLKSIYESGPGTQRLISTLNYHRHRRAKHGF